MSRNAQRATGNGQRATIDPPVTQQQWPALRDNYLSGHHAEVPSNKQLPGGALGRDVTDHG
jgi:hypothetical protein